MQSSILYFDQFELDLNSYELRKSGRVIKLEKLPTELLILLAEKQGQLVSREQIILRLWGDNVFVDTRQGINTAVRKLRVALHDDPEHPRLLQTVAGRGYRLLAPVSGPASPNVPKVETTAPNTTTKSMGAAQTTPARSSIHRWKIATIVAIATCAILAAVLGWLWRTQHQHTHAAVSVKLIPLTTYPGIEQDPSLSPDGSQVAFSWNGPDQANFDIFVKTTSANSLGAVPLRLTTNPADDIDPQWSPDGSSIAFLRKISATNRFAVLLIPALGGPERKLAEVSIPMVWLRPPYLSWMPGSQSLVITDQPSPERPTALYLLSIRTGAKQQLTFPPAGAGGDSCAAVSPDGKALAFHRVGTLGQWRGSIYLLGLDDDFNPRGEPRSVAPEPGPPPSHLYWSCVTWTADGGRLLFPYDLRLWTVPILFEGQNPVLGKATMVIETGNEVSGITASRTSERLAYSIRNGGNENIWRFQIPTTHEKTEPPTRLIASTKTEFAQLYSPDGSKVAFESGRGGNLEIWVCDSEGQNCTQLTSMGASATGIPAWSPDGEQIAFYSNAGGTSQIYVIPVSGGATRRLTSESTGAIFPRWSRNGLWIYFSSKRSGTSQIWKVPSTGGPAVQVTHSGGFASSESPDGSWLYFTGEGTDASLWKVPVGGGAETQVLPSVYCWNFAIADDGVYFVTRTGHEYSIEFLSFATGKTELISPIQEGYFGFSVSPDRKRILYAQGVPWSSELVLAEGFK